LVMRFRLVPAVQLISLLNSAASLPMLSS